MTDIAMSSKVVEVIQRIAKQYYSATASRYPENPVHNEITRVLPKALEELLSTEKYVIRGHDGKGNWAHVPWVGVSRSSFNAGGQRGIYLAILFSRMGNMVYFSLQQGSEALTPTQLTQTAESLLKRYSLSKGSRMNLESQATRPRRYMDADIFNVPISVAEITQRNLAAALSIVLPVLDKIADDFESVSDYEQWVKTHDHAGDDVVAPEIGNIEKIRTMMFSGVLQDGHISAVAQIAWLMQSSLANPFAILTGTSGSGKTRLARRIGATLANKNRSLLIPVGADWTDNRHVMGYVNHLVRDEGRPVYQTTPIVELLLAASGDPDHPYFLILDEMNLSHVERYFADFLSKMESRDEVIFHSEGGPLKGSTGVEVPASIPCIPPNLFVIGTVNVDETTYMFSPKVLDRAQVIEFRVKPDEAKAYLGSESGGSLPDPEPDEQAGRAFLDLSLRARGLRQPPLPNPEDMDELKGALGKLFELMHGWRMEFAYRTMNEVIRYARVSFELETDKSQWSWRACLDTQILQKILPKLHGNKKRLEPVLIGLIQFCEMGHTPDTKTTYRTDFSSTPSVRRILKSDQDPAVFDRSYEKLCDMLDAVRRDQYVSFIQ
jgi:hypothetical protein